MIHTKFDQNQPSGFEKKIFKEFYHILVWQPSWSCDMDHVDEFSFPCTYKLTFKNWL